MWLTRFLRRARWDEERARELESYLAEEIADNLARGMTPAAARTAACRKLGNPTRIREEIYTMNSLGFAETLWQDLRYGARLLRRNPTFAVVAILTLALGTGANTAIFQLVNSLRLRPLPVERPGELVSIDIDTHGKGRTGWGMNRRGIITEPLWRAINSGQQAFSQVFAYGITRWDLASGGESQPIAGLYVTGGFFDGLGVRAQVGRVLSPADDRPGCATPGAVLADGFWKARYGGSPSAIGQVIRLDGHPFDIIGVTPPGFFGVEVGRTFDVAVPLCAEPVIRGENSAIGRPDRWFLDPMGRLKPGWTVARAQAQLAAISSGVFTMTTPPAYNAETAKHYAANSLLAKPGGTGVSGLRRAYQTQLWVLLGATGLVLLIACANIANLMLARATARQREIAVRLALGASRWRLIRQMLSESLLIAAGGAAGGMLLAAWLSATLVSYLSTETNRIFLDLAFDWRAFGFILLLAVCSCLLFGLSPALTATAAAPGRAMIAGGRSQTDTRERHTLRRVLVVVQIALSTVLIVGALLFASSLRKLAHVDTGFRVDGVIAVDVDLRRANVPVEGRLHVYDDIQARLRAVPGVQVAAQTGVAPMSGSTWNGQVVIDGAVREGEVYFNRVSGDYFQALDVPLLSGRSFDARDRAGATPVAMVNRAFAQRYFGGQSPLGRSFKEDGGPGDVVQTSEVIGVVGDTKYRELREEVMPIAYYAAAQERDPGASVSIIIRSALPLASLRPALTAAIADAVPAATVSYDTLARYIRDSLVTERLMASLSLVFGVLAIAIATVGLYGVMSYLVARRQAEIGIRMALGAERGRVVRMIVGEAGVLLAMGVVGGTALAIVAGRSAATLLYGLKPWDPLTLAIAIGSLATASLAASWLPAQRASRVPPSLALRAE
ncbi:MAG: ABC transporter permease [Vicinamibacterales bacterium]